LGTSVEEVAAHNFVLTPPPRAISPDCPDLGSLDCCRQYLTFTKTGMMRKREHT